MHERMASLVALACHEAGALCAVNEAHNAVVAQHKRLGELADRRPVLCAAAAYREQKLMLGRGQAVRVCLFLAPVQEATQICAQVQELLVLRICQVIENEGIVS